MRRSSSIQTTRTRSPPRSTRMLQDRDLLDNLAAAGLARVSAFTWEATARATIASLRRACETARR